MKTNIEIAQAATLRPITALAADRFGIPEEALEPYGRHKAKVSLSYIHSLADRADGKLVLVAAISPTPTVFDQCHDDMSIVREEIFGPVMMVLEFDEEEKAIRRANATQLGLSAGVFTQDLNRAHRVIEKLQAGSCWINHYNICPMELPFGGYKHSGIGRENGRITMEHYTQLKSVYVAKGNIDSPY